MSVPTITRRRGVCSILAVTALLTACSSGSTPDSTAGATPSEAITTPLTVGLTYLDNSAAGTSLGAGGATTVNAKTAAEALVRGINLAGGLAGRKLTVIEYAFHTQDANYSSAASAACALFTQDNHVQVVLDNAFGTIGGFRDCLQQANVFDITTQSEGDAQASMKAKLHANTLAMTLERAYTATLTALTAGGYLTPNNQMGVIVENCPDNVNAYKQTLLPAITQAGLKTPKEARFDCTAGFGSAGAAAAALNNAVLTFRRGHVDRVMFVSSYESVALFLFATAANSQSFQPGYVLTSNAQAALHAMLPPAQQRQIHGAGHAPFSDVDNPAPSDADNRCLALTKAGGISAATAEDRSTVVFACSPALLLEAALKSTNGDAGATALATAIGRLGSTFHGPGLIDGRTKYGPTKLDGPDTVQEFTFASACSCVRYIGNPAPAP